MTIIQMNQDKVLTSVLMKVDRHDQNAILSIRWVEERFPSSSTLRPKRLGDIEALRVTAVNREWDWYSSVYVWRERRGRYWLRYGRQTDHKKYDGTGAFTTQAKAEAWFYNGGR